jgi:tetratricopeptide (TPR) repeat protein
MRRASLKKQSRSTQKIASTTIISRSASKSFSVTTRRLRYLIRLCRLSLMRARRFEEASHSLSKAAEIRPSDFNANYWRGISLLRVHKFLEAIPSFEKARQIRRQDKASKVELFTCYLATQQFQKGVRIFPFFVAALGGALTLVYVVGFALLLPFSLPIRAAAFPGLRFSLAWLALFFEGQITFLLLFALFPPLRLNESVFSGMMLAALPIIVVATIGFSHQRWGSAISMAVTFRNVENSGDIVPSHARALFDERGIFTAVCGVRA